MCGRESDEPLEVCGVRQKEARNIIYFNIHENKAAIWVQEVGSAASAAGKMGVNLDVGSEGGSPGALWLCSGGAE